MAKTSTTTPTDIDPLEAVISALRDGGPRTAGQLADYMAIPYSSLSPRLRRLEADGRAERVQDPHSRVVVWHTTPAATAATIDSDTDGADTAEVAAETATAVSDTTVAGAGGDEPDSHDRGEATYGDPVPEPDANPVDAAGTPAQSATDPTGTDATADDTTAVDIEPNGNRSSALPRSPSTVSSDPGDLAIGNDPKAVAAEAEAVEGRTRRGHGEIPAAILALTRAHPDTAYKVSQLARELGGLSAGAIANAAHKLAARGELLCVNEHPVTFQAA